VNSDDLTVAIPTRDRWEIVERTLAALRTQTVSGFDVIVVCDGEDQQPPPPIADAPDVRVLRQPHAGPGAARNTAVHASDRPWLLLLGDDMVAAPDLVERHLQRHARDAATTTAVLGHVHWHPEVSRGRVMRWLEWSDAQFDYRQLRRELDAGHEQAGFGRFYSCNVSISRELFLAAGGFDPDFHFDYEDLDFGWRLDQQGMRLVYEPAAVTYHLHRHDWESVVRRYESRARAERLMASKHPWFSPWFHSRITAAAAHPPASPLWARLVDLIPQRAPALRTAVERRADLWYHQQLAPRFISAWEGELELEELREYLGPAYDHDRLVRHHQLVDEEAAAAADEGSFYRSSDAYLYDLTVFAMSGTKDPYREVVKQLTPRGGSVLDYGCGIGSDGLRLLADGYRVAFADFDNPSVAYLRWRLQRRARTAEIYDLDGEIPDGFDTVYAFDVIEHVDDPFAFLAELERRAAVVVVNLLEPIADDTPLHRTLPIDELLRHARQRGVLHHRRYHGRSHLVAYRTAAARSSHSRGS
jgi:GT2 family glycosyltransferase/SAM-dependent methyltransferase